MIRDTNFGRLSGRQLTLRWVVPIAFTKWTRRGGFSFDAWQLLNPLRWFRTIFRGDYRAWWRLHRDCNHRCYCAIGTSFDGSLVAAGWGVVWFYSHYTGEVPCWCDKALAELDGADDAEEAARPRGRPQLADLRRRSRNALGREME